MAGTIIGGKLAAKSNYKRHGADFYQRIGALGGSKGRTGGFYNNAELASAAGRIGGMMSRRGINKARRVLTDAEKAKVRRKKEFEKAYKHLQEIQRLAQMPKYATYKNNPMTRRQTVR
jgi:general stress protein YciG